MERRRQIGGGEKHTGSSKDDAKESLDMRILLRRVCAGKALVNLPRSEEFAKVITGESLPLVRTDDVGLLNCSYSPSLAPTSAMKASRQLVAEAASMLCEGQMRP